MKRGEQQKILHKGSNDKVNVFHYTSLSSKWNQIQYKQDQK